MGRTWLLPVLLGLWVCGETVAEGCSCGPRSAMCGPPEDFWRVGAVFAGRVTAIQRPAAAEHVAAGKRKIRIQVTERFRGEIPTPGGEIFVFTDAPALCGFPFRIGKEYFVYAARQDGFLTTSTCLRTGPIEQAQMDLAYARNAVLVVPPPGRIVGEVRLAGEKRGRTRPLSGVPIVISSNGAGRTTATDSSGRYAIEPGAAGTYVIDVQLPETQFTPNTGQHIDFASPHGCTEVNVDVFYDGRITGHIIDSMGRDVAGVTVCYQRAARVGSPVEQRRVLTRDDGTYSFQKLPPGAFAVHVELPTADPDVCGGGAGSDRLQHQSLRTVLAAGERLSLPPIVLPSSYRLARLEGTVHEVTGAPAANARVFLKDAADRGRILGEPAVTDSLGRFVMAVIEGVDYHVFAERQPTDRHGADFSDPLKFTALPAMSPLRLTLSRRF